MAEKILAKHTQAELAQKAGAVVPKMLLFMPETIDSLLSSGENISESMASFFPVFKASAWLPMAAPHQE